MTSNDFRSTIRNLLNEGAPLSLRGKQESSYDGTWGGRNFKFPHPDYREWLNFSVEHRLTAPTWPREYGGGGYSETEAKIIVEEMIRLQLPPPLIGIGLLMIGPTILKYGTEEQKKFFLPKIVRGEIRWCQGFSEPGSGSDLASISTSAKLEEADYRVNGQKIWTSYGHLSDWIFALVRTNKSQVKQDGITFLLIDLETKGVTVKPIQLISGSSHFCETFFDDVKVPVANVLGEVNKGWEVAKVLLDFERLALSKLNNKFSMMGGTPQKKARPVKVGVTPLGSLAMDYTNLENGKLADKVLRNEIAQLEMLIQANKLTNQRLAEMARAGEPSSAVLAMKLIGMEINQKRETLRMKIIGPKAIAWEGLGFEEDEIESARRWLRSRGNSIEGGTSEIQLNIIAKRILALPQN